MKARLYIHKDDHCIPYRKLCICTGAKPNIVHNHTNIIGIRDIDSIDVLRSKLLLANNIVLVGNGGIALEMINLVRFYMYENII